ncbi:MAG: heparin lyase I family protein [Spirochaetes bacterium]|nr:heparin lyase I family protein [Spirochaetota bacterium]
MRSGEISMINKTVMVLMLMLLPFTNRFPFSAEETNLLPFVKSGFILDDPYTSVKGENSVFSKTFEDGSLNGFTGIEAAEGHFGILDRNEPDNKKAVWFSVTGDQEAENGSISSEIVFDNHDPEGSLMWYGWYFFVPENFRFPSDYNLRSKKPLIIAGKWHSQPNPFKKEKVQTAGSFTIAYGIMREDSVLKMVLIYGTEKNGFASTAFPFKPGKWNRVATEIKWSTAADGNARTYLNGISVASASGPNMNNHFHHYLKIGLYRDRTVKTENYIAYDDIKIGFKKSDVE